MVRNPTQQIARRQNADEAAMAIQDRNRVNALVQHEAGDISNVGGRRSGDHSSGHEVRQFSVRGWAARGCGCQVRYLTQQSPIRDDPHEYAMD